MNASWDKAATRSVLIKFLSRLIYDPASITNKFQAFFFSLASRTVNVVARRERGALTVKISKKNRVAIKSDKNFYRKKHYSYKIGRVWQ